ncbi:ABC transporter substrate-binding protein [Cohnella massiliensis]|uniref:ABC transporter substrate-binding protein n=1 Tax=Cohnella massiliensis TaxID=1816691 RepID=UPI0009BC458C|nr:ABC transporter substrate-binding protein [Cohnella massiliensis]
MPVPFPRKPIIPFLIILLSAALLSACGTGHNAASPSPSSSPSASEASSPAATESAAPAAGEAAVRSYRDALGRTVEIPTAPERIIAHYYAAEMEALDVPVVGTNYVNAKLTLTDEQLQGVEDIGGEGLVPNLEKTLSLSPDLILVPDFLQPTDLEALSKIAPTVVVAYGDDVFTRLGVLADLIGQPEKAENWIANYQKKAEEKRQLVQSVIKEGETASAFILHSNKQFYVYNKQRLGPTLYDAFGFGVPPKVAELFADKPNELWAAIPLETLPDYVGDRVFLVYQSNTDEAKKATEELIQGPVWKNLPAVKEGRAYVVESRWAMNDPLTLDWLLDEMVALLAP